MVCRVDIEILWLTLGSARPILAMAAVVVIVIARGVHLPTAADHQSLGLGRADSLVKPHPRQLSAYRFQL